MLTNRQYLWIAIFLATVGLGIIFAIWQINNSSDSSASLPRDVAEEIPGAESNVPRQSSIGIELKGVEQYDIQLWLNGEPIPLDEAQISNTRFTYIPDEGKSIEQLNVGPNCIRAEYSRLSRPEEFKSHNWCFTAN